MQTLERELIEALGSRRLRPVPPDEEWDARFLKWLRDDCGYLAPVQIGSHWVACEQLLFHGSMVGGDMGDYVTVRWRYCYRDVPTAFTAMLKWIDGGCQGEPADWHKRRSIPIRIEAKA